MEPLEFLVFTQQIERKLGRERKSVDSRHFDRTIDIDILFTEPEVRIESEKLMLPHPKMHNRPFVMVPLQEILQKNA